MKSVESVLANILPISLASCFGVALRIILTTFSKRYSIPAPTFLLPNIVGCFLMSQTLGSSSSTPEWVSVSVTTGLCGALTSFSAWQLLSASILIVEHNVPGWLLALAVGLSVWISSYACGRHACSLGNLFHSVVLAAIIIAGIVGAVFLGITDKQYISVALGPVGGLVRYFFSLGFNKGINGKCTDWFPFGTFFSNIVGCIIAGVVLLSTKDPDHPAIIGLAGSLTTVSTFAAEISHLDTLKQYRYVLLSILFAQIVLVNIFVSISQKS